MKTQKSKSLINRIQILLFIICTIMFAVAITMIIFAIILKNCYTPDMGSLIGGTLGGIGTLVAVMFTIKDNSERDEQAKISNAMPYLDVFHLNGGNYHNNQNYYDTDYQLIIDDDKLIQKVGFNVGNAKYRLELLIKNIGLNTATNIFLQLQHNEHKYSSIHPFSLEKSFCSRRVLVFFEENFPSDNIEGNYDIILTFKDLYGTNYTQSYSFEIVKDTNNNYLLKDFIAYKTNPSIT